MFRSPATRRIYTRALRSPMAGSHAKCAFYRGLTKVHGIAIAIFEILSLMETVQAKNIEESLLNGIGALFNFDTIESRL